MSNKLMIILLAEYMVLLGVACFEKRWGMSLYWLGAAVLQLGVLVGMK